MAERFYSAYHPDEAALFVNYNVTQQQQLLSQQQQHQLITMGQQQPQQQHSVAIAGATSCDLSSYLSNTAHFAAAASTVGAVDMNNRSVASLRYFRGCTLPQQQYGYSKTASATSASNMLSSSCVHSMHQLANASQLCYNRNRYMPYNRACAAPTTVAAVAANPAARCYPSYQLFTPIYQSCTSAPTTAAVAANLPVPPGVPTAVVNAETSHLSVSNTTTTIKSGENSYAHAAGSTLSLTDGISSSLLGSASTAGSLVKKPVPGSGPTATTGASTSTPYNGANQSYGAVADPNQVVTLQITNLDYSMDEASLRNFLLNQLKPITPVVSLVFEGSSYAKVTVPDLFFAKQVVSNLHRKKIGHKRMLVSYTRDSSLTEINTLRCQVAGLLKDVPYYTLPMYKFRELFQSRFKTSISVLDLYKMQDICTINSDNNEEKFISLQPELVNSLESSPLMEGLQHSVPYCTLHFKREQHKGWAEQDIEPLPTVCMTIQEIQQIIYPLLKSHTGDIPVASLVHCIEGELKVQVKPNENGVNLEHLICCAQGIQIQVNNFGIKILSWLESEKEGSANAASNSVERNTYAKNFIADPLYQISREVIELVKMSPKSTMKFNRFIPAYHNHFGKQCRVADYGYTKLIELFEALSSVVQIMGDGENRQITLTHRTQIRRFTSDLLRVLRAHGNKSVLLSQLPNIFAQTQSRTFDVMDYGVCDIVDILDGLVNSNIVVVTTVQSGKDILISIPKRKQTNSEVEKTAVFAGEMVELFRNAPQYTIFFQKFVRSYHYHFAYQCRLSDYGFLKLADLMEAISGVVEMEQTNDEDKKIYLSPTVARRVFAEQCEELINASTGSAKTCMKLDDVLKLHKKKFGYQILPQTLGVKEILDAVEILPYVEMLEKEESTWIICHSEDTKFRTLCYRACKYIYAPENDTATDGSDSSSKGTSPPESLVVVPRKRTLTLKAFMSEFNAKYKETITENVIKAMKHAIRIYDEEDVRYVQISDFMKFLLNIVRLLEQRSTMLVYELRNALEYNNKTSFEYGYANLFSVLSAYPDVFSITVGTTQERSEISLLPTTELRFSSHRHHLYGSLKLPYAKQKTTRPLPLGEHNSRVSNVQGPPAKTRAVSSDSNHHMPAISTSSLAHKAGNSLNQYYQPTSKIASHMPPTQQAIASIYASTHDHSANSLNSSSIYSTATQHSSSLNTSTSASSNKENSLNNSLNMFTTSFNSSSNSLSDFNASIGGGVLPHMQDTSTLWDRRHSSFYQQQGNGGTNAMTTMGSVDLPPLLTHSNLGMGMPAPPPATLAERAGLYEFVSNMQMYPMYEPPKPDTPPIDNMPFWIDPIWTNNNGIEPAKNNNLLNIKLPEMKALNMLPMLLSPYTLSKNENMKKQVFSFENHDRKIA